MSRYGRDAKLDRLWRMLKNSRNGLRLEHMAGELGCTTRTVRRYLDALSNDANYPVYKEETVRGPVWMAIAESRKEDVLPISDEEIASLVLARRMLECKGENTSLIESLDAIISKLKVCRSPEFIREVNEVRDNILVSPAIGIDSGEVVPHCLMVNEAIRRRRKMRFDYRDQRGFLTKGRIIAPHCFVISNERVYLVAHCYLRNETRQFIPERMENLLITEEPITEQFDFDSGKYAESMVLGFHAEPEDILLEVNEWITHYFNRCVRLPGQTIYEQDGTHFMRFRAGPSWALVWWLSQFGPNIRVIEPEPLRDWVAEFVRDAAARYTAG